MLIFAMIAGTLIYIVELKEDGTSPFTSIPMGIYYAIVSITTVGYGDITVQTTLGQLNHFTHVFSQATPSSLSLQGSWLAIWFAKPCVLTKPPMPVQAAVFTAICPMPLIAGNVENTWNYKIKKEIKDLKTNLVYLGFLFTYLTPVCLV